MKKYYQIDTSIDEKIIGESELSLSVEIEDKDFIEQSMEYFDIEYYFEKKDQIYDNFPKSLVGKMYQKNKEPIDFMDTIPMFPPNLFVVSQKFKDIIESLNVGQSEYHFEELKIKGYTNPFYFLFIPMIKSVDCIDFTRTVYRNSDTGEEKIYGSYESYWNCPVEEVLRYNPKTIYLSIDLSRYDIISIQGASPVFYSERLIKAFEENNVIGYEIVKKSVDLVFPI